MVLFPAAGHMPKIFYDPTRTLLPPPTYLMYDPLYRPVCVNKLHTAFLTLKGKVVYLIQSGLTDSQMDSNSIEMNFYCSKLILLQSFYCSG